MFSQFFSFILLVLLITACQSENKNQAGDPPVFSINLSPPPTPPITPKANPTDQIVNPPTPPITPRVAPSLPDAGEVIPIPTPAENPPRLGFGASNAVPTELANGVRQLVKDSPQHFAWIEDGQETTDEIASLVLNGGTPLGEWLYVVAAPFATILDEMSMPDLQAGWTTNGASFGTLVIDANTAATLTEMWGAPAPTVQIVEESNLVNALWAARPSWTISPFNRLVPEMKVLRLNGQSPLDRNFDPSLYPLKAQIGVAGDDPAVEALLQSWRWPRTNYDPNRLTRVAMSGVTALGRATAYQMEVGGITAPGVVVAPVLQAADIAHISHEVPFAPDCPYPNPVSDPIFCASDRYMDLLTSIGTDIVELTGNHVNDWGAENMVHSMDLYEAAGMKTFGGGRNLPEAKEPALFEHNGNKIAFVGCNPVGPAYAWATDGSAGSLPCDYPALYAQISALRDQGYSVIATLQYQEFYHYEATAQQEADFRALAEAGATAVSGSQGHHAQGFDFYNGAFIHHGLGNLFFDQMQMLGTRQSFIDTYTFYDGHLINVDLFTSLIENFCCPRAMSPDERAQLLQSVFQASGW